ncbi:MAG: hypothetical protein U0325_03195 [Polyangiales bacterium]
MACSPLTGRNATDAARALDANIAADLDAPAVDRISPRDAGPSGDSAACSRGAAPIVDSRFRVTIEHTGDFTALSVPTPRAAAVDAEGRMYLAGSCYRCVRGLNINTAVWRFGADGAFDTSYGDRGVALESAAHSTTWFGVTLDAAGRAVVVGRREGAGPAVARFDVNGAPDEGFNAAWLASLPVGRLGVGPRLAFSAVADAQGVLVVGSDNYTELGEANLGFALRLTEQGEVDATFATGGVYRSEALRGCFDVVRDGDGWVLGCVSLRQRPVLIRLDAGGRRVAWPSGKMEAEHAIAPTGFQLRGLRRDSAGRWLAVGAISRVYFDSGAPAAAVRFLRDGEADPRYGRDGVAFVHGANQSFTYTYASTAAVTCEDRLVLGVTFGNIPGVALFDRDGRLLTGPGDEGVFLTARRGFGAITFGVLAHGDGVTAVAHYPGPMNSSVSEMFRLRF